MITELMIFGAISLIIAIIAWFVGKKVWRDRESAEVQIKSNKLPIGYFSWTAFYFDQVLPNEHRFKSRYVELFICEPLNCVASEGKSINDSIEAVKIGFDLDFVMARVFEEQRDNFLTRDEIQYCLHGVSMLHPTQMDAIKEKLWQQMKLITR